MTNGAVRKGVRSTDININVDAQHCSHSRKGIFNKKHLNLRIKMRRNTSIWPASSQGRDTHNYDSSGCKAGTHSCSLKEAPTRPVRYGGLTRAALLCRKTGIFPSNRENLLKRGSCPVLSLAWPSLGGTRSPVQALGSAMDPPLPGLHVSSPFLHFSGAK